MPSLNLLYNPDTAKKNWFNFLNIFSKGFNAFCKADGRCRVDAVEFNTDAFCNMAHWQIGK